MYTNKDIAYEQRQKQGNMMKSQYAEDFERVNLQGRVINHLQDNYCGDRQIGFSKQHRESRSPHRDMFKETLADEWSDDEQFGTLQEQQQVYLNQQQEIRQAEEKDVNKQVQIENSQSKNINNNNNKKKEQKSKYKPSAKKLDPKTQKERLDRRNQRIKQFNQNTRWLPNTAFQTYFGKPAFENYGNANTKPTNGGMVNGQYLLTHNVNPHRTFNNPKYMQSYNNAINQAKQTVTLEPPRQTKAEFILSQHQVEELKNRNPIGPPVNKSYCPDKTFKKTMQSNENTLRYEVPDLVNTIRFASKENSVQNEEPAWKQSVNIQNQQQQQNKGQSGILQNKNVQKQNYVQQQQQQQQNQYIQQQNQYPQQQQNQQKQNNFQQQNQNQISKANYQHNINTSPMKKTNFPMEQRQSDFNFIEEKKKRTEKQNNLTLKVTEIDKNCLFKTEQQLVKNPKNYKNLDPRYTHIPTAGKTTAGQMTHVSDCLEQNHSFQPEKNQKIVKKLQRFLISKGVFFSFKWLQNLLSNIKHDLSIEYQQREQNIVKEQISFQKFCEISEKHDFNMNQDENNALYNYFTKNSSSALHLFGLIKDILFDRVYPSENDEENKEVDDFQKFIGLIGAKYRKLNK